MTVTVILIIAVIVVLAVLLLLLLGMRALNPGSRSDGHDDFDDEYDDHDDDRGADAQRGRRQRKGSGVPGFMKRRRVDWEDDDGDDGLSDNDFWSSLNEEGPAQRPARGRGRGGRGSNGGQYDEYEYEYEEHEYDDGPYEDEQEDERDARRGPRTPVGGSDLGHGPSENEPPSTPGPQTNMMALADLGRGDGPQQVVGRDSGGQGRSTGRERPEAPYSGTGRSEQSSSETVAHPGPPASGSERAAPYRDDRSSLPSDDGNRGLPAAGPSGDSHDPLGSASWSTGPSALPPRSEAPLDGPLSTPSAGPGTPYSGGTGAAGGGASGASGPTATSAPYGAPFDGGRLSAGPSQGPGSPYDSGVHNRPDPGSGSRSSPDPLDPDFRPAPSSSGPEPVSPIWSSMDTGTHQRPDPSALRSPEPPVSGGPSPYGGSEQVHGQPAQPGQSDPLAGHGAPFRQGGPNAPAQPSPYESGTHSRPGQGPPAWGRPEDTGHHTRSEQGQAPWGSPNETGNRAHPGQGPPLWGNSGDTGGHARPDQGRPPWDGPSEAPQWSGPGDGGPRTPASGWNPSADTGNHSRPAPGAPMWGDPGTAGNPNDTGSHTYPGQGRAPWDHPNDPAVRPGQAPQWGEPHDTGNYARPDPGAPWGASPDLPGSGGDHRPWDTGTHSRSAQQTDPYGWQGSPYDSGTHARPSGPGAPGNGWENPAAGAPNDGAPAAHPGGSYGTPGWGSGAPDHPAAPTASQETDPYGWQGSPYDSGTHARAGQGPAPWDVSEDTGTHTRPDQGGAPMWGNPNDMTTQVHPPVSGWGPNEDTGTHTRPAPGGAPMWGDPGGPANPNESGSHARPDQGAGAWGPAHDTGNHHRPWDSGTHAYPARGTDLSGWQSPHHDSGAFNRPVPGEAPPWGVQDGGFPGSPAGTHGDHGAPRGNGPSPFDSGTHAAQPGPGGQPTQAPSGALWNNPLQPGPGGGSQAPGEPPTHPYQATPTGGYPADLWSGGAPGYAGEPPQNEAPGPGYADMLDGGYAPPSPSQHGGPAPADGWGTPSPSASTAPYPRDAYGRPLPPEDYYDDGRFR